MVVYNSRQPQTWRRLFASLGLIVVASLAGLFVELKAARSSGVKR